MDANIAGNIIAENQVPNAAEAEGLRILRETIFMIAATWVMKHVSNLDEITIVKGFQDQGDQRYCPEKALLGCEEKGCLNSKGLKTNNEICPPDAQFPNYRGCACTDCVDAKYTPLCDNCGGAVAPPSGLEGRSLLGSEGNLLPRVAPSLDQPRNQTCKGVSDSPPLDLHQSDDNLLINRHVVLKPTLERLSLPAREPLSRPLEAFQRTPPASPTGSTQPPCDELPAPGPRSKQRPIRELVRQRRKQLRPMPQNRRERLQKLRQKQIRRAL